MKNVLFFFCIAFFLCSQYSGAQYYNTGQDPGSLKWMQIKTGRFKVIYPKSYGEEGINFARSLDYAYLKLSSLYPEKKIRIPIIIHNYTTESNGYVAWAPSRMEVYPTPEQNGIPLDPDTQLALHELTHVFQMESLNKSFTKALSYVAGQQIPGIVSSLLPLWFLEGDAVFSESFLSESGRGRTPSFQKQLKALVIEKGGIYKYDKIVNGSFRDFVPDHYRTGYQIMAYSYSKYNRQLWEKALDYTAGAPFTINPVNLSMNKYASVTKKKLFLETFDTLKRVWTNDDSKSGSVTYSTLNPSKGKKYINYYSPVMAGHDSIIAVRTSLSDPPSFVLIRPSERKEKRILIPGFSYPWLISYGKGKLVWVETHTDPRWANRTWSVIKVMNLNSMTTKKLSSKTRYLSASISPDGNYIAAAENTSDNRNNLVILDAWNGTVIETVPVPDNASLQRPQWDNTSKTLTVIYLTDQGEGIRSYNFASKAWKILIEPGRNDIQSSFLRNDSLFFVTSEPGTDNIYLLKPDRSLVSLTNSRFGVADLNMSGSLMLFSDYSSSGNNICYSFLPAPGTATEIKSTQSSLLINRFKPYQTSDETKPDTVYKPVPYRKGTSLFRFHSWMPFYADIETVQNDPASIKPGFTLLSQNNLSTLVSAFGYEYSDNRSKLHASIKWLGWYPEYETRVDYGNPPYIEKFREQVDDPADIEKGYEWTNTISLPLSFHGGRFTKYLYLSAASTYRNDYVYVKEKGSYDKGQNQLTGRIYFSNSQRPAYRDIYPRWAQTLDLNYSFHPFDKDIYGDIFTVKSALYFPGFFSSNGIKIRLEAEMQRPEKYILGNRASFPRSYDNIISKEIRFGSVDYFMPLFYPDFNIASFFYLTRIRADYFYDYSRATGNYVFMETESGTTREYHDYTESFKSFGIELMGDFYFIRLPFMISGGVQAAWRNTGETPFLKLLFTIDLFGMSIGRKDI